MKSYTTHEVRKKFKDFVLEAYAKNEIVYVLHYNKPMAALVPIKYAKIIEELIKQGKQNELGTGISDYSV